MNNLTKKQQVLENLKNEYPKLIINEVYDGHVIEILDNTVLARIYDENCEEYDCEFKKHIFPEDGFSDNVIFLLILGDLNKKPFIHVNYFFWTQEEIEASKKEAEELIKILKFE